MKDFSVMPIYEVTPIRKGLGRAYAIKHPWKAEPYFRFVQVLKGQGRYQFEASEQRVKQGDILLFKPGSRAIVGEKFIELFSTHFDIPVVSHRKKLLASFGNAICFTGDEHQRSVLQGALQDARQEIVCDRDLTRAKLQLQIVLHLFFSEQEHGQKHESSQQAIPKDFQAVASQLTMSPDARVTVVELAGQCTQSPRQFRRLFKYYYGTSPAHYAIEQRIAYAKELLSEEKMSVKEAALSLGYADAYCFSKQFKEVAGCSPSRYGDGQ